MIENNENFNAENDIAQEYKDTVEETITNFSSIIVSSSHTKEACKYFVESIDQQVILNENNGRISGNDRISEDVGDNLIKIISDDEKFSLEHLQNNLLNENDNQVCLSSENEKTCIQNNRRKKQLFVLSETGKPIYCRFSDEKNIALCGVLQALVSIVQDDDDTIKSISANSHCYTFVIKGPVVLVMIGANGENEHIMSLHLNYVYHQIISILTLPQLNRISQEWRGYDLRQILGGSERLLEALINYMEAEPAVFVKGFRLAPLSFSVRNSINQMIVYTFNKIKKLKQQNCLKAISGLLMSPQINIDFIQSSDVRHFLYKSISTKQFISPAVEAPYTDSSELISVYSFLEHKLHACRSPLKVVYIVHDLEVFFAWVGDDCEIYVTFEPFLKKENVMPTVNKLIKLIKKDEDKYFIKSWPSF